ncbi:DUF2537 domain-containing protein [Tsukamurella asaccharolytica]|uniref:DUF2537 domain-containing protein n=1 Tax=Tsukamurella asaccharolytica TaxID=2592067 RepID=A0A5C5R6X8_9ACTN|nr:DUF2537 domain-containing protein [Tsukamurella asaccharolytica]TWS18819.1 DUF2537 domain-containing protein [Tsukamurella asaccharolytica]
MSAPRYPPRITGTAVAVLVALLVGGVLSGLFVSVMAVNRWLGLFLLALGAAGAVPVLAAYRERPVARWFCAGFAGAIAFALLAAVVALTSGLV